MVRLVRGSLGRYSARSYHERKSLSSTADCNAICTQTRDDCCDLILQADKDQRAKEEKIRIAIQKIKAADIKKVCSI